MWLIFEQDTVLWKNYSLFHGQFVPLFGLETKPRRCKFETEKPILRLFEECYKHFFKHFDLLDKTLPIPPVSNFYVDKVAPSETALAIKIQYQLILFYFQMASAMERPMLRISQARSKDLISVSQVRFLTASYAQRS